MADDKQRPPAPSEKGEERAREKDPHGTASGGEASEAQPKGSPSSDRHDTQTAANGPGRT